MRTCTVSRKSIQYLGQMDNKNIFSVLVNKLAAMPILGLFIKIASDNIVHLTFMIASKKAEKNSTLRLFQFPDVIIVLLDRTVT